MKLLTLLLLINFTSANGQTRKETEDWLLFNLNKYVGDDFDIASQPGKDYTYYSYTYEINGNKLIYTESNHHVTSSSKPPGTVTSQTKTIINLSKIIKISQENNADESFPIKFLKIYFNFNEYPDLQNPGVKQIDVLNQKDLTGKTYYTLFTALFSVNQNALKENMPSRFIKALEHLAELNGAQIIKDVF